MIRFLLLPACFAVSLPALAAEPSAGTPIAGVGVVSVDQKLVFLPGKEGVEAVDLATGKVLWTNKDAGKLAGASDKLVFAWSGDAKKANTFRVFAIDPATGKTVGKSEPIAMPDWAMTAKIHGHTFRTAAKADGEGAVVVWQAGTFYAGGANPTQEILEAAKKDASGVVKIDFKAGKNTIENRKPKEDEFNTSPLGTFQPKLGDYEFRTSEQLPGLKPGSVTKVTFTVLKNGKELWSRELAGNPFSPPPP